MTHLIRKMVKTISRKRIKANLRDSVRRGVRLRLLQQEQTIQRNLQNKKQNPENGSVSEPESLDTEPASTQLRLWALKHNITRNALSELLTILISFGMTFLPSDPRTLLQTPKHITSVNIANGQLWYNGIENNLRKIFSKLDRNLELVLNFNVDGIPLFDSAKKEFWPILANIHSKI